jgi:hypothetical protein
MLFVARKGRKALQSAISSGQHSHPDGLFFSGTEPLKTRSGYRSAGRATEVVVNHFDLAEPLTPCLLNQFVLSALALEIHLDLGLSRLPDIDHCFALKYCSG